jgi:hypothetical protein
MKGIYPASSGIADSDFFWHLTYGRWIVEHRALPTTDFFSWTMTGQPYQLTQWLGEAAMGLAYNLAGLDGTKLFAVLLAAITIGFAWLGARRHVHTAMAFGLALVCNLVQIAAPMRPQLFSFALLSVAAYLVTNFIATRRLRYLAAYPVLMAFWVNLHGGFIVGLILIGLMATGLTAEAFLAKVLQSSPRTWAIPWWTAVVSTLATLINPYGIDALFNVFSIGGLRSASVISEWLPVNITTPLGWFYLLNLVPYVALMLVSKRAPRLTHGLIAAFFLLFGVMANRQVAICAAVMAPFTAALLAQTPQYARMLPTLRDPSHPAIHMLVIAVLAGSFPTFAVKANDAWEATMNLLHPIKATDFLERYQLTGRVMSDTLEASYLIHRGVPVFIDGRLDLFRDSFFFEWYLASRAVPGWQNILEKYRPHALLLRLDTAIRQAALAGGGWKQVFEDDRYSILVPSSHPLPAVAPKPIIYLDAQGRRIRPYIP